MVCLYCSSPTQVINSRPQKRTNTTWRRRQCQSCKAVFSSVEQADMSKSLVFEAGNGHLEPFSRLRLFISVYESLKHRKTALKDAEALCDTIISRVVSVSNNGSIKRGVLIDTATKVLQRFDNPAAVHYCAYYKVSR